MNICLYGASSNSIDQSYIDATEKLGEVMAKHRHHLIYGGGALGLMGAAARGVMSQKGVVIGIAPSFFQVDGILFKECTEFIYTTTMRERKKLMEEKSDAFIMVPGGPGTLDEFFEILTLKQLGRHNKPIAIYNINRYFDKLNEMLDNAVKENFMTDGCRKLWKSFDRADDLITYIENYQSEKVDVRHLKSLINTDAVR